MDKIEAQASRAGDILQSLRAMVKRHQFEMTKIDVGQVVTEGLKLAELESNLLRSSSKSRLRRTSRWSSPTMSRFSRSY